MDTENSAIITPFTVIDVDTTPLYHAALSPKNTRRPKVNNF